MPRQNLLFTPHIVMIKKYFFLAALLMGGTAQAQSPLETYSVYDVNHKDGITVADATMVVSRAIETITEDPQVVDAAVLNRVLQQIDARLAAIEAKLGLVAPEDSAPDVEPDPEDPASDPFNGHDYIDLGTVIDGKKVLWATCNIGAETPEDAGLFFAWGDTEGHSANASDGHYFDWSTAPFNGGNTSYSLAAFNAVKAEVCPDGVLALEYDAAHVNWEGDWRMPTDKELQWLCDPDNCTQEWMGNGFKFTSLINSQSIFFLAAGYSFHQISMNAADDKEVYAYPNEIGYYWSSSLWSSDQSRACYMLFSTNGRLMQRNPRSYGMTIRPVIVLSE